MSIMSPASLVGGIGEIFRNIGEVAIGTLPIWGPYLPQPKSAPPVWQPAPPTVPYPGGGTPVSQPIAHPGGAPIYLPGTTPAFGFPGADLAPTGSIPIVPNPITGTLPATVLAPYVTRCGKQSWTIYEKMGRPALMSGHFRAERKVRRVAGKARRRTRGGR